jgi:hypothetical protein
MNVSMVGQPANDFAHFGHNFRTNPVAGQNKEGVGAHKKPFRLSQLAD